MKNIKFFVIISLVTGLLIGCKESTETNTIAETDITPTSVEQTVKESTPTQSTENNYYSDLLSDNAKQEEDKKTQHTNDMNRAEKLLKDCTRGLTTCKINIEGNARYKCINTETQTVTTGDVPTNGHYTVNTTIELTADEINCEYSQTKILYRDSNVLSDNKSTIRLIGTLPDTWTNSMNMKLDVDIPEIDYNAVIQQDVTKGDVYSYTGQDVRSVLKDILTINITELDTSSEDKLIIKGITKNANVMLDSINGSSIIDNKEWFNPHTTSNVINTIHTNNDLTKQKNIVTLYIDKNTERLTDFEVTNETDNEATEIKGSIVNITE